MAELTEKVPQDVTQQRIVFNDEDAHWLPQGPPLRTQASTVPWIRECLRSAQKRTPGWQIPGADPHYWKGPDHGMVADSTVGAAHDGGASVPAARCSVALGSSDAYSRQ